MPNKILGISCWTVAGILFALADALRCAPVGFMGILLAFAGAYFLALGIYQSDLPILKHWLQSLLRPLRSPQRHPGFPVIPPNQKPENPPANP